MKKVIAFDLDDTISHFVETWLYYYNIKGYDNVLKEDIVDWDITQFVKGSNKNLIMSILELPEIYLNARIKDNARGTLEYIQNIADVYIVTAPGKNYKVYQPKYSWVAANLPNFNLKHLVFLNDKHLFKSDMLIDDNPETLDKYIDHTSGNAYLYDNPWNRKSDHHRFNNWSQIKKFMEDVL